MQILELVLYGYNQKVRHLPFKLGQVNIITGRSKSARPRDTRSAAAKSGRGSR